LAAVAILLFSFDQTRLILRSGPQGRVSKDENQSWCCPPFETALRASSG
jgi:hypothetical protein